MSEPQCSVCFDSFTMADGDEDITGLCDHCAQDAVTALRDELTEAKRERDEANSESARRYELAQRETTRAVLAEAEVERLTKDRDKLQRAFDAFPNHGYCKCHDVIEPLAAERDRLRRAVEEAPHDDRCNDRCNVAQLAAIESFGVGVGVVTYGIPAGIALTEYERTCSCWKSRALEAKP